MTDVNASSSVVPVTNLKAFFHQALHEAAETQRLRADDTIMAYLTHLLTDYARSDRLFDRTQDGIVRRPLVDIYKQASEAETSGERELALQRLGDLALFVSGVLPHSLQRSLVDVDYYIAMGASAYGSLSDSTSPGARVRALRSVFVQLSHRFVDFVDLVAETIEQGQSIRHPDLMRLHDLWSKTGSRRLGRKLVEYGVVPQRALAIN
jgi:Rad3-related DNA helicase